MLTDNRFGKIILWEYLQKARVWPYRALARNTPKMHPLQQENQHLLLQERAQNEIWIKRYLI